MKTLLLLAFSLTTALAPLANAAKAEDQDQAKPPKKQQQQAPPRQPPVVRPAPKFQPNTNVRQQTPVYRPPQFKPAPTYQAPKVRSWSQDAPRPIRPNPNPEAVARPRPNPNVISPPRPVTTVPPRADGRNHSQGDDRDTRDRNWRNRNSHNNSWYEARRRHHRHHHHRSWWRSHYTRFALFGTGYFFWDNGYWFPAYGYDPAYNTYAYDEPIYGYNGLDPAQVISNVQAELQRLGYYRDAVDGWMGPNTRAALADFQRDNGLAITAAIDEPTLQTLGLE